MREHEPRMRDEVLDMIRGLSERATTLTVSQWAERKRVLTSELSSLPGPYRFSVTPYLREIADCFSESSPVQRVAVMKGSQVGLSVGVLENVLGYIVDEVPGPALFVSGDRSLAEDTMSLRIDRMLESAGLSDRIFAQVENKHGRRTGDTRSTKEFPGGFLRAVGPNTGSKLRAFSVRYGLLDELDAWPAEAKLEGDPVRLVERRTDAFERVRKILYISTPLVDQSSKIKPLFDGGDQRYYYVPCKHCGAMQALQFENLRYETDDAGRLVWDSVHYVCEECGGTWKNHDKAWMLPRGEWRPTAEPSEPNYRSYHISALYSPVGMRSWESICAQWITDHTSQATLRNFKNTVQGLPWVEAGEAPDYARVALRRGAYESGNLPDDAQPLFVTLGADVQGDRIECEVVAWGRDKESWSVNYFVLEGDTSDLYSPAWRLFYQVLMRKHAGFQIALALVDSGYRTPNVNEFVSQFATGVMAVQGQDGGRRSRRNVFKRTRLASHGIERIDLDVDPLKSELYGYLRPDKYEDEGRLGRPHFPVDYSQQYFQSLTAEEAKREVRRSGYVRYRWVKRYERNEALDCRVYAMGALYVLATDISERAFGVDYIDWPQFWTWAEKWAEVQRTENQTAAASGEGR
jgi:phage terminase large subunit GpA-like protein